MAIVTPDHRWLDRNKLTAEKMSVIIKEVVQEDKDLIIRVENDILGLCAMSIWGDNKNILIKKISEDTDKWIAQKVFLHKEDAIDGKKYIILSC